MQRWTRKAAAAVTAVVLATGSIGCSDDDAGRLLTQIFINLTGAGAYDSVSVTIDPDLLGTLIDTTTCDLAAALAGCNVDVSAAGFDAVTDKGIASSSTLPSGPVTVTIDSCPAPIQAFSNLVNCLTTEAVGGIEELFVGSGVCAAGSACDTSPEICVTTSGPDDFCGVPEPTTSTSSTSSTSITVSTVTTLSSTTSTSSTTTTTIPVGPSTECTITFGVGSDVGPLGALSYDTDYNTTLGQFEGSGPGVSCTGLVGQLVQFNDQDTPPNSTLITAMIDTGGFSTPTDTATCTWLVAAGQPNPVAGDFSITVTDAADPGTNPVVVTVDVTDIQCDTTTTTSAPSTSSTSSSTSTTQSTTTSSTTTTTGGGGVQSWNVVVAVNQATTIGALQFNNDYSAAVASVGGGFQGSGQTVDCEVIPDIGLGFPAFNNCDTPGGCGGGLAESTLVSAITSVSGFTTVANEDIVRCTYDSVSAPAPGDFALTVVDASDPATNPITVTVFISAVTPQP